MTRNLRVVRRQPTFDTPPESAPVIDPYNEYRDADDEVEGIYEPVDPDRPDWSTFIPDYDEQSCTAYYDGKPIVTLLIRHLPDGHEVRDEATDYRLWLVGSEEEAKFRANAFIEGYQQGYESGATNRGRW